MNIKLLEIKSNQKIGYVIAVYFAKLIQITKLIQPSVRRVFLVMVGEIIVILSGFFVYSFFFLFSHTSYRFVSVFLLVILSSNILAKIVSKFIETYND